MTAPALGMFFLGPAAELLHDGGDPAAWLRLAMSIGLAALLLRNRDDVRVLQLPGKRALGNVLFTAGMCIVAPLLVHAIRGFPVMEMGTPLGAGDVFGLWCFQFSFAAVSEEPLFRGFLWGWLKGKGFHDGWICMIQALLFWAGHVYYLGTGINFWLVHPLLALLLGVVAWRTRSIACTMVLHASVNTFSDLLRNFHF